NYQRQQPLFSQYQTSQNYRRPTQYRSQSQATLTQQVEDFPNPQRIIDATAQQYNSPSLRQNSNQYSAPTYNGNSQSQNYNQQQRNANGQGVSLNLNEFDIHTFNHRNGLVQAGR